LLFTLLPKQSNRQGGARAVDLPVRSPWCSAATYLVRNCYVSVGIDDGSGVEKGVGQRVLLY